MYFPPRIAWMRFASVRCDGEQNRASFRRSSSERPHPGAQLSFTDHDGYRFQCFLTDQDDPDIAVLERRQRQRARVENQIRDDKDTGLSKLPFKDFAMNQVWLELVLIAHNLLAWSKALLLEGALAKAEPKRLRHRLLHVAGRLAFHGRRARLRLQRDWPWTTYRGPFTPITTLVPTPREACPQNPAFEFDSV